MGRWSVFALVAVLGACAPAWAQGTPSALVEQLRDPDHEVAEAYGTWGARSAEGRMKEGIIRSSFLIDEHGTIVQATYNVKPEETVPKAQEALA